MGFFNCGNKKRAKGGLFTTTIMFLRLQIRSINGHLTVIQINEMQNYIATASNGKTSFLQTGEIIQKML